MMDTMPYRSADAQRAYQRGWHQKRRLAWLTGRVCVDCGETDTTRLVIVGAKRGMWSWSEARRGEVLVSSKVLCRACRRLVPPTVSPSTVKMWRRQWAAILDSGPTRVVVSRSVGHSRYLAPLFRAIVEAVQAEERKRRAPDIAAVRFQRAARFCVDLADWRTVGKPWRDRRRRKPKPTRYPEFPPSKTFRSLPPVTAELAGLIGASSVGQGLRRIREEGVDVEVACLEAEMRLTKPRKPPVHHPAVSHQCVVCPRKATVERDGTWLCEECAAPPKRAHLVDASEVLVYVPSGLVSKPGLEFEGKL